MVEWRVDFAFGELQSKKATIEAITSNDSEATTRLRAIDTIIFDVLKWDKTLVEPEKYCRTEGYADYVFSLPVGKPHLVLEAKKRGTSFLLPDASFESTPYSFQLLAKEYPEAMEALKQALHYAAEIGSTYIAISNGHQWLLALTFVPGESVSERFVYVFESIAAIENRFRLFWDCFSKEGLERNAVYGKLLESRRTPAPPKFSTKIVGYARTANRNPHKNELGYILDYVWQFVSQNENSQEFAENCYVCPADHGDIIELAKELIKKRRKEDGILRDYDIVSVDELPHQMARLPAERPFIILGEVGRGKTSFLKYLRLVAASDILESYIQIDIDFLDKPDDKDGIAAYVYDEVERQLKEKHSIDVYENSFVRGVLHGEIMRLRNTPKGELYSGDLTRYREYEVEHIESITRNRHNYFTKVMHHLKKGRSCSIALYFDNLDRREPPIQEAAFLKCSSIARDWCSLVFVCLRPSTFYESKQDGVLDTIAPKTFTVSQPNLAVVLKRRFAYAKSIAQGEEMKDPLSQIAPSKQIAFDLPNVVKIFESCEFASSKSRGVIPMLEAVSNGNIRTMLDYVKSILTSGYLDTVKMLKYIDESGYYTLPDFEGVKTLLYGDCMHYDPANSIFINLFDIQYAEPKGHFLRYAILKYLTRFFGDNTSRGYVSVSSLYQSMASLGCCRADIVDGVKHLYETKCVKGKIERLKWSEKIEYICITSLGLYHVGNLLTTFQYMDAIVFDTPILDSSFRNSLTDKIDIQSRLDRTELMLDYLDSAVASVYDTTLVSDWKDASREARANIAEIRERIAKKSPSI